LVCAIACDTDIASSAENAAAATPLILLEKNVIILMTSH
jgi:hypothetical protein